VPRKNWTSNINEERKSRILENLRAGNGLKNDSFTGEEKYRARRRLRAIRRAINKCRLMTNGRRSDETTRAPSQP